MRGSACIHHHTCQLCCVRLQTNMGMVTGSVQGSKAPSSAEDQKEAGKEAAAKSFAEGDILWIEPA